MTDKELIELAAKAAGLVIDKSETNGGGSGNTGFDILGNAFLDWHNSTIWNPLADDGDAFRLAVKLNIDFYMGADSDGPEAGVGYYLPGRDNKLHTCEPIRKDPYAATRRAIVRAAAAIGKALLENKK